MQEDLCFTILSLTLQDDEKRWVGSLEPGEITTWDQLITKLMKFIPPRENARQRSEQKDRETLYDGWSRYKQTRMPGNEVRRKIEKLCKMHGVGTEG